MCRLFGLLADPVVPADGWLTTSEYSLLAQSNVPGRKAQKDGWGIGWYDSRSVLHVEKGIGGAFEPGEKERFTATARLAKGPLVFGHLRNASNPLNLPRERLIALENSQPFSYQNLLFIHNGSIPFPRETRPLLGEFESKVKGVNDSEVLFWLLVRHVTDGLDPLKAFAATIADLTAVWKENLRPQPGPYSGLNVIFSTGPTDLWAFCTWFGETGPCFFDANRPFFEMAYEASTKRVVVGSEPFDAQPKRWKTLGRNQYLHAEAGRGLVGLTVGEIPLPQKAAAPAR
jgi:hypothetical protein